MIKKSNFKEKGGPWEKNSTIRAFRLIASTYFLTYKGISDSGQKLTKETLANYLIKQNQNDRKLCPEKYLVCEQMYDSGQPHFHAILVYPRRKQITTPDFFDFLGIHPNIQTMRNMKAALDYLHKQDPQPLTNMDITQQRRRAKAGKSSSLYSLLREQMITDPFNFDVYDYLRTYDIDRQVYGTNYTKAIALLRSMQQSHCRGILQNLPSLRLITPELITERLTLTQVDRFYSHPCYQRIVDHLNQIYRWPNRDVTSMAPQKTPHLLLVGTSDIGKSALITHRATSQHPHFGLSHYLATYHLSIGQKYFPPYRSFVYRLVRWNQFTIASDMFPKSSYHRLLDYLQGAPSALPQKGRPPVERQDNPKHILTSNRTLQEHICKTFSSEQSRIMARMNLRARVDQVLIPPGHDLHFLRKLFVPMIFDSTLVL